MTINEEEEEEPNTPPSKTRKRNLEEKSIRKRVKKILNFDLYKDKYFALFSVSYILQKKKTLE